LFDQNICKGRERYQMHISIDQQQMSQEIFLSLKCFPVRKIKKISTKWLNLLHFTRWIPIISITPQMISNPDTTTAIKKIIVYTEI